MKQIIIYFFDFWLSDFAWYRNLQPKYYWYKAAFENEAGYNEEWWKDLRSWDELLLEFERIEKKLKSA